MSQSHTDDDNNWMLRIYRDNNNEDEKDADWLDPFQLRLNKTPRIEVEMDMDRWSKLLNEFYERLGEEKIQLQEQPTRRSLREILDEWSSQIGELNEWYRDEYKFRFGDPLAEKSKDKTNPLTPDQLLV